MLTAKRETKLSNFLMLPICARALRTSLRPMIEENPRTRMLTTKLRK